MLKELKHIEKRVNTFTDQMAKAVGDGEDLLEKVIIKKYHRLNKSKVAFTKEDPGTIKK